jgi:hypothetical protein
MVYAIENILLTPLLDKVFLSSNNLQLVEGNRYLVKEMYARYAFLESLFTKLYCLEVIVTLFFLYISIYCMYKNQFPKYSTRHKWQWITLSSILTNQVIVS